MHVGMQRAESDLRYALAFFPSVSLENLLANEHRLIRDAFRKGDRGCLFNLLAEVLPPKQQINGRKALTRFFTGSSGHPYCELAVYQPARFITRAWDSKVNLQTKDRYPGVPLPLSKAVVLRIVAEVLEERQTLAAMEQTADACVELQYAA